jgi:hypothetical protein
MALGHDLQGLALSAHQTKTHEPVARGFYRRRKQGFESIRTAGPQIASHQNFPGAATYTVVTQQFSVVGNDLYVRF